MKACLIEICAYSLQSVLNAEKGGAKRVELCSNPFEGGTTPSTAFIQMALEKTSLDVHVLIRPRGGDFLYTDLEYEQMMKEVLTCKALGVKGVVLGFLTKDGEVDVKRTSQMVRLASPMSVTFHRAFDVSRDPFISLEKIIDSGCHRILSSGQKQDALHGSKLLKQLIDKSNGRIQLMPGGGIGEKNILEVLRCTGATELHMSAKVFLQSGMEYRKESVSMGGSAFENEYRTIESSVERISLMVKLVTDFCKKQN